MTLSLEIALMWATVIVYATGSITYIAGGVFAHRLLLTAALWVSALGLALHTAGIAVRWARVGHAPFLGYYEVIGAYAYATVVTVVAVSLWRRELRALGMVLMPLSLLALGAAMLADKTDELVSGSLASWWLTVHVAFAKLSYSSFIVSFALAVAFLIRRRSGDEGRRTILDKLPSQEAVDDLSYRFAAVGLVFLTVMIGAGAIWANESWGRYWGWDPIETWSLVTWLVYSGYLHTRLTLGWRGHRSAWFSVAALPVVAFAFGVVPIVYQSIHAAYLKGF